MFSRLPTNFQKLETLVRSLDAGSLVPPPEVEVLGQRLRTLYAAARTRDYLGLSSSNIRKLPYAYWIRGIDSLDVTDPDLVRRYWEEFLPNALAGSSRRTKRWLAPLLFSYCEAFDRESRAFLAFSTRILAAVAGSQGSFADRLKSMHRSIAFFDPKAVPVRLADAVLTHPKGIREAFEEHFLWESFCMTPLADAAFEAALNASPESLRGLRLPSRLIQWASQLSASIEKTQHRVQFANALLGAWKAHKAPESTKDLLLKFFVSPQRYGDPRIHRHLHYQWDGVSSGAIAVVMNWLAGDTLRIFMQVLEKTADEIWQYRRKFWVAYYDAGYINEAWLVLGRDALRQVRSLELQDHSLQFGQLEGGATLNQSVLMLKIGNLLFIEWSHNGSLRAYPEDSRSAPALYQSRYHGDDLRASGSLDFHDGINQTPQLRHMHSSHGTWQRKARDLIRAQTGISLRDGEIL